MTTKAATSNTTNVSYELFAPRSTAQVSKLSRIAALTAGPVQQSSLSLGGKNTSDDNKNINVLKIYAPPALSSSSVSALSLLSEDDDDENNFTTVAMEKATQNSDKLIRLVKHTKSLRLALRASINIAEDISNRHAELIRHSGELSAAADRLQGEQELLTRHAEEIGAPLKHYDAIDKIGVMVGVLFKGKTTVRGLAKIKVDDDNFPDTLNQIDDAVEFFERESGGRDALEAELKRQRGSNKKDQFETRGSIEYYRRSLALQDAALFLIREAVVDRIQTTTSQVASALDIPKTPIAADKLEASLVYTRFHGISSRSNRLLSLVRKRLHRGDAYHTLLQLCRTTYCNSRDSLLKTTIRSHMDKLKDQHGLVGMTRLASVFLIRLCTVETALYLDFFGDKKSSNDNNEGGNDKQEKQKKNAEASGGIPSLASRVVPEDAPYYEKDFQGYLSSLSSALHATVRRGLVTVLDLDTLCQIVSVLREERSMASSSPTTLAAARAISGVIEDAQERLIFCATNSLTKEVIKFKATSKDLDYPNKLITKEDGGASSGKTPSSQSNTENNNNSSSSSSSSVVVEDDAVQKQLRVYESWFPPMRSVLRILSKIFRVVEPKVFEDIALQSVQSCTRSLRDGSKHIQKRSGTIHADLFLVKHLLILREQLSPFDIDLRSVERQLDFSDAGKAVSRFLANRNRRLFSMSTENALVTLLREGVSVNEESVDSKRDLEEALRDACNGFIDHTCNSLAHDVLELASKLESSTADTINSSSSSFFQATSVKDVLAKTLQSFDTNAKEVLSQMALYLDNPTTQSILLKPISKKISKGLDEIRKNATAVKNDGNDLGWDDTIRTEVLQLVDDIEKNVKRIGRATK